LAEVDADRLLLNVGAMRYFDALIQRSRLHMTGKQWDFLLCVLDGWFGEEKSVSH